MQPAQDPWEFVNWADWKPADADALTLLAANELVVARATTAVAMMVSGRMETPCFFVDGPVEQPLTRRSRLESKFKPQKMLGVNGR